MLDNNRNETNESGKMLALTLVLTNFLLLAIVGGVFWLVQLLLSQTGQLNFLTRGFGIS
ncbi:MAG: hypothetical protein JSS81_12320 [Acidobacteria bacterium]|nr:hypothetical protein [Acidobacteriota bacterium]